MKGYSFRSLTDLVLKIFKTKVNAGTGLSGGGSLEADRTLTVKYGTAAGTATQGNDSRVVNAASNATVNAKEAALETKKADKATTITAGTGLSGGGTLAADRTLNVSYGTAAGTVAQGNDSRLSNSREWTGATISQAEAEAGTATTRRAFTAQRVRQAIVAWFNSVSGELGRRILTRTTAAQVRSDIGLGTAATANLTTSVLDKTAGRVLRVNDFGIGSGAQLSDFSDVTIPNGFYRWTAGSANRPENISDTFGTVIVTGRTVANDAGSNHRGRILIGLNTDRIWFQRSVNLAPWTTPVQILHTSNIRQTTGTSPEFPMSQKATTNQLDTKAALSHTHPWSQVTDKPAQAVRWPTFMEVEDKPIVQAIGTSTTSFMSQAAVTDQLDTKANTSTQVIAGTGLTGGGTLAENRTLSIAASHTPIGVGQSWQNVLGQRSSGTRYTNTTGRTIAVSARGNRVSSGGGHIYIAVDNNTVMYFDSGNLLNLSGYPFFSVFGLVPPGATYSITASSGLSTWSELR